MLYHVPYVQPPPSPAEGESTEVCTRWLNYACALLNPDRQLHRAVQVEEMQALVRSAPPPPPVLEEEWSTRVWAMPGEPHLVYLLRCLAHQGGLTLLAPNFAVPAPCAPGAADAVVAAWDERSDPGAPRLFWERCVVAGVRVEPVSQNLLQVGWDTQPCPYCVDTDATAAAPLPPQQQHNRASALPLLYGGSHCDRCGAPLPLAPAWTRALYLVLQRHDRRRVAAVAYGEAVHGHLRLGALVDALLYTSATEQREPLLVVHAAAPASGVMNTRAQGAPYLAAHMGCDERHLALHQKPSETCAQDLFELASRTAPQLQGQTHVKRLLLLVVLHTVYRTAHPTPADGEEEGGAAVPQLQPWHPLHLLLVGSAKTGKSALLREVALLLGPVAEVIDSTVVRVCGGGGTPSSSLVAAVHPVRRRAVLMAGAGMTATTTLLLDELPSLTAAGSTGSTGGGGGAASATTALLLEALERGCGCVASGDGAETNGSAAASGAPHPHPLPCSIVAASGEESASAAQLTPFFSLVAAVVPTHSLDDTAVISQDVVAASRARASQSRSHSRSCSAGGSGGLSQRHGDSGSQQRPPQHRNADGATSAVERLTHAEVCRLVRDAAGPQVLSRALSPAVCYAAYMDELVDCVALVEEALPPACSTLPPPASCRGRRVVGDEGAATGAWRATPLVFHQHLRVLQSLSRARLMLEPAACVCELGLTSQMRDEVWELYRGHLVACADLVQRRHGGQSGRGGGASSECGALAGPHWTPARPGAAFPGVAAYTSAGSSQGGMWQSPPRRSAGAPLRTLSRKQCRLRFVEELQQRLRVSCAPERDAAVPCAEVEELFTRLGGGAVFGDPLDVVMSQMQHEGFVLRRPGGWRPV